MCLKKLGTTALERRDANLFQLYVLSVAQTPAYVGAKCMTKDRKETRVWSGFLQLTVACSDSVCFCSVMAPRVAQEHKGGRKLALFSSVPSTSVLSHFVLTVIYKVHANSPIFK